MKKPGIGNYIKTHRELIFSIKDDWAPQVLKEISSLKVYEVFSQEDNKNVLIRVSINRGSDFEMIRDIIISFSMKDLFLGEVLKEVDWYPNTLSQNWLLSKGYTYL